MLFSRGGNIIIPREVNCCVKYLASCVWSWQWQEAAVKVFKQKGNDSELLFGIMRMSFPQQSSCEQTLRLFLCC